MATATDLSAINETLDDLGALLTHHGAILTHLEQLPIPDIQGLARRLEDVADAVERLKTPEPATRPWWLTPGVVLLAVVVGWGLCWATVRWLPGSMLPPGFSRIEPLKQKGRL